MLKLRRESIRHLADIPWPSDPHREHATRELLIDIRDVVRAGDGRESVMKETEIEVEGTMERAVAERAIPAAILENRRTCLQAEHHRLRPLVGGEEDRITRGTLLPLDRFHCRAPAGPVARH